VSRSPSPRVRRAVVLCAVTAGVVAQSLVVSPGPDGVPPAAASPARPPANRLLHGPQLYRLRTVERSDRYEATSYTYAMVFMFSRVHWASTFAEDEGAAEITGGYTVGGVPIEDNAQDVLYAPKYRPRRCLVAYVDTGESSAADLRRLDRYAVGQRVPVTLAPLLSDSASFDFGATYHRRPVLRQGGTFDLTERGVQRQLRAIHCDRHPV
jgi:hypothetical protein